MMRRITLVILLVFLHQHLTSAHWILSQIGVDGRLAPEGSHQNPFFEGIHSSPTVPADSHPNMKCGPLGVPGSNIKPFEANPGDRIAVRWLHDRSFIPFDIADNSNHHGPCMAYVAPLNSGGNGAVWTKLWHEGLDRSKGPETWDGKGWEGPFVGWWCSDNVRVNHGYMHFNLPPNLPHGDYLLRVEMLTTKLPGAGDTAQAYVACATMRVGGGGVPPVFPDAVAIPEVYKGHPWMQYQLYGGYPNNIPGIPGPEPSTNFGVDTSETGSSPSAAPTSSSSSSSGTVVSISRKIKILEAKITRLTARIEALEGRF
eukprot:TRINITY_DN6901_c0_g1_i1.p1 TRINITY_DN6901_c0_g1~~TRINITY_DN6901_c0_g1_i1.p1  ORF type:complete len:314 (-),score=53.39 TRINITY_DN6901_c0_g1_i1:49-990(-)